MKLTAHTLKKLVLMMVALGVINTVLILLLGPEAAIPLVGFTIVMIFVVLSMSKHSLKDKVTMQVMQKWNFKEISDKSYLGKLLIGSKVGFFQNQKSKYKNGWQGQLDNSNVEVLKFSVEVGSGESSILKDYLGIKINSNLPGIRLQVLDNSNSIKNVLPYKTVLESVEFSNKFRVFTQERGSSGFYILPPDVMQDLLSLRATLDTEINLEVNQDYVLIFIDTVKADILFENLISLNEAMDQKLDEQKIEPFKNILLEILKSCQDIFHSLDIKSKN